MALDGAMRVMTRATRRFRLTHRASRLTSTRLGLTHRATRLMSSSGGTVTAPGRSGSTQSRLGSSTALRSRLGRAFGGMHVRLTATGAGSVAARGGTVVVVVVVFHLLQAQVEALLPFWRRVWCSPTAALLAFPGLPPCPYSTAPFCVAAWCHEFWLPCGGHTSLVHVAPGIHHSWFSYHFWNGQETVVCVHHSYCDIGVPCKRSMNLDFQHHSLPTQAC